jgi:hypothetical protein
MQKSIRSLKTSRKPMTQLFGSFLYNILTQFGIPMKQVRLIKLCLNETHSKVWIGKIVSGALPIQNSLKQ